MSEQTCKKCNGTGKVVHDVAPEAITDRITMTGGFMSELCECRKAMPRVHGVAKWWSDEPVKTITAPLLIHHATVTISAELPISADNRPLIRDAANFYYPSTASIDTFSELLFAQDLRSIAKALLEAADEMDAFDDARAKLVEVTR